MNAKLEALRALIEAQNKARFAADWQRDHDRFVAGHPLGCDYPLEIHARDWTCTLKTGRKYVNVDVGMSGRYMVELATGTIFGIKAYGVIHRGHSYGTLDTINNWDWGDYRAAKKQGVAA